MTSDTRQRILDVASELFAEQGYDATSLREIADRLGFTKAALYYHFQSKDEILKALVEPAYELVERAHRAARGGDRRRRLGRRAHRRDRRGSTTTSTSSGSSTATVTPSSSSASSSSTQDHLQMHQRVEAAAHAAASSVQEEIRMVAALGAVTGFDDWAPTLLAASPPEMLRAELTATVRDILRLPARRHAKTLATHR